MSIAAFYRNWVPFAKAFSYYDLEMEWVTEYQIVYVKGNIQPWKEGLTLDAAAWGTYFRDRRIVYTKHQVEFSWDELGYEEGASYFYEDGRWFLVEGFQNWSKAGRNPKHFKYSGFYAEGFEAEIGEPTPMPELVESFETIVSELSALTTIIA